MYPFPEEFVQRVPSLIIKKREKITQHKQKRTINYNNKNWTYSWRHMVISEAHTVHHDSLLHVSKTLLISFQRFRFCFISDFMFKLNCGTSCERLSECTHTIQTECLAYITIQTLLLWKALSFLLCAGKHHWEHEQNTSKQDTNSCCCWLHGWMPLSICLWFRGKERRQNSTNYGIHHTNHSDWSL